MFKKIEAIKKLFGDTEVKCYYNNEEKRYYYSVDDVLKNLSDNTQNLNDIKKVLKPEGSKLRESFTKYKFYSDEEDTSTIDGIFKLIMDINSKKSEKFKMWLACLGYDRICEIYDPELAVSRAINYYRTYGYSYKWISDKLSLVVDREKLFGKYVDVIDSDDAEFKVLADEIKECYMGKC